MIHPQYFIDPSDEGIIRHYQALARATGLGLMVYSTKGSVATPTLMRRLAEIDSVVALKDEYGDLRLFAEMVQELGSRIVWVNGMAEVWAAPYFVLGAQAFTSGLVNFAPKLSLQVWETGSAGRWDDLQSFVARKIRVLATLRERKRGYSVTVIKEAMNLLGLRGGTIRSPLVPLASEDRQDLRHALIEIGLLAR
jgi:5-dehydro-4-deoxyglucarate dehydratase